MDRTPSLEILTERVHSQSKRIEANHESVVQLREMASKRDKEIGEFRVELREARKEASDDINSIKRIFIWLLGFSGTAAVALITLILQIALTK